MTSRVSEIFSECQRHSAVHKSSVKKLSSVLGEQDGKGLEECMDLILRGYVDQYLLIVKKESAVERVVKFFCDFMAASCSFESDAIFVQGMEHLLKRSAVTDKNVRYRACQSLSFIMTNIADGVPVSDSLLENIMKTITPRLKDKDAKVRMFACKCLTLLQDGENPEDPLVLEFIRLMKTDSAAAVRVCAVDCVAICPTTLAPLVARVRDVKPEVRIAALERLTSQVDIRHLSSTQRATVATFGLGDRDTGCRNVAVGLVQKWASTLDNRIPKLLTMIGLVHNASAVQLVGNALIDVVENPGKNPFPASAGLKRAVRELAPMWSAGEITNITGSEILWVQLRCEYARTNFAPAVAEDTVSRLLPDIVVLCNLLENAHKSQNIPSKESLKSSVLSLLRMTKFLDGADISGGIELTKVCENMLLDILIPDDIIEDVLDAWLRGLGRTDDGTIQKKIRELSEKFASMDTDSIEEADDLDIEILTATRGLQLISWAMSKGVNGENNNRNLSSDYSEFVINSLQSTSPDMRCLAVQCLGMMSLSSEELCSSYRDIIVQVAAQDLEEMEVRNQALQAVADAALAYSTLFRDDIMISNLLLRIMKDSENLFTTLPLRLTATEATVKLLFSRTLHDPRLFSALMQIFFVPDLLQSDKHDTGSGKNGDNDADIQANIVRLQQMLSIFFQSYNAVHSSCNETADQEGITILNECVADLFSDIIVQCRDGSAPLSLLGKVCSYVLNLMEKFQGSKNSSENYQVQSRFAASISREALKIGNSKLDKAIVKELMKILSTFSPKEWASGNYGRQMASCALKSAKCIKRNCPMDKTTQSSLEIYMNSCINAIDSQVKEDETQECENPDEVLDDAEAFRRFEANRQAEKEKEHFYTLAPGLFDLVDMIAVDDSDMDSEVSEEESSEEEEEEEEQEENAKSAEDAAGTSTQENALEDLARNGELELPKPPVKASSRSAATAKGTTKSVPSRATSTRAKKAAPIVQESAPATRRSARATRSSRKVIQNDSTDEVDPENADPQQV